MTIEKKRWEIRQGDPTKPGVTKFPAGYNFSICIESAGSVELIFYRKDGDEPEQVISLSEDYRIGNVYAVTVLKTNLNSYEYEYRLDGNVIQDHCARVICDNTAFGKKTVQKEKKYRYSVLREMPVEHKKRYIPYEDMIIYKVHVRGYTMQKNSRVRKKGTFQGLSEKIAYWKEMGVTSIELMPAYDFREYPEEKVKDRYMALEYAEERLNYWGYTSGNYFAPKASYCAGASPEQEVKGFISKLHTEGMECLMDFYFPKEIEPQLVLEILRFWKIEYDVDGFILFGEGVWNELISRDPILSDTKLICPGWNVDQKPKPKTMPVRRLAEYNSGFQDTMRRFLKGDEEQLPGVLYYAKRNPSGYGVINYMANHDGFTLADLVTYDYRHNEENGENNRDGSSCNYSYNCGVEGPTRKPAVMEVRGKQMRNAVLLLMLSQGTPLIYGGDEVGNSQKGNNNAYCQDNEIGWVDWSSAKRFSGFTSFIREVIRFRKSHPILHMPHELRATDYKSLGWPELSYHSEKAWFSNTEGCSRHSGILYCGGYAKKEDGSADDFIYVMYNMHWHECAFAIPDLPEGMKWYLAIDSCKKAEEAVAVPGKEKEIHEKKSLMVPARSIMVFIGK